MEQSRFAIKGQTELGPEQFPLFVDGEVVGPVLIEHFRPPKVR